MSGWWWTREAHTLLVPEVEDLQRDASMLLDACERAKRAMAPRVAPACETCGSERACQWCGGDEREAHRADCPYVEVVLATEKATLQGGSRLDPSRLSASIQSNVVHLATLMERLEKAQRGECWGERGWLIVDGVRYCCTRHAKAIRAVLRPETVAHLGRPFYVGPYVEDEQ